MSDEQGQEATQPDYVARAALGVVQRTAALVSPWVRRWLADDSPKEHRARRLPGSSGRAPMLSRTLPDLVLRIQRMSERESQTLGGQPNNDLADSFSSEIVRRYTEGSQIGGKYRPEVRRSLATPSDLPLPGVAAVSRISPQTATPSMPLEQLADLFAESSAGGGSSDVQRAPEFGESDAPAPVTFADIQGAVRRSAQMRASASSQSAPVPPRSEATSTPQPAETAQRTARPSQPRETPSSMVAAIEERIRRAQARGSAQQAAAATPDLQRSPVVQPAPVEEPVVQRESTPDDVIHSKADAIADRIRQAKLRRAEQTGAGTLPASPNPEDTHFSRAAAIEARINQAKQTATGGTSVLRASHEPDSPVYSRAADISERIRQAKARSAGETGGESTDTPSVQRAARPDELSAESDTSGEVTPSLFDEIENRIRRAQAPQPGQDTAQGVSNVQRQSDPSLSPVPPASQIDEVGAVRRSPQDPAGDRAARLQDRIQQARERLSGDVQRSPQDPAGVSSKQSPSPRPGIPPQVKRVRAFSRSEVITPERKAPDLKSLAQALTAPPDAPVQRVPVTRPPQDPRPSVSSAAVESAQREPDSTQVEPPVIQRKEIGAQSSTQPAAANMPDDASNIIASSPVAAQAPEAIQRSSAPDEAPSVPQNPTDVEPRRGDAVQRGAAELPSAVQSQATHTGSAPTDSQTTTERGLDVQRASGVPAPLAQRDSNAVDLDSHELPDAPAPGTLVNPPQVAKPATPAVQRSSAEPLTVSRKASVEGEEAEPVRRTPSVTEPIAASQFDPANSGTGTGTPSAEQQDLAHAQDTDIDAPVVQRAADSQAAPILDVDRVDAEAPSLQRQVGSFVSAAADVPAASDTLRPANADKSPASVQGRGPESIQRSVAPFDSSQSGESVVEGSAPPENSGETSRPAVQRMPSEPSRGQGPDEAVTAQTTSSVQRVIDASAGQQEGQLAKSPSVPEARPSARPARTQRESVTPAVQRQPDEQLATSGQAAEEPPQTGAETPLGDQSVQRMPAEPADPVSSSDTVAAPSLASTDLEASARPALQRTVDVSSVEASRVAIEPAATGGTALGGPEVQRAFDESGVSGHPTPSFGELVKSEASSSEGAPSAGTSSPSIRRAPDDSGGVDEGEAVDRVMPAVGSMETERSVQRAVEQDASPVSGEQLSQPAVQRQPDEPDRTDQDHSDRGALSPLQRSAVETEATVPESRIQRAAQANDHPPASVSPQMPAEPKISPAPPAVQRAAVSSEKSAIARENASATQGALDHPTSAPSSASEPALQRTPETPLTPNDAQAQRSFVPDVSTTSRTAVEPPLASATTDQRAALVSAPDSEEHPIQRAPEEQDQADAEQMPSATAADSEILQRRVDSGHEASPVQLTPDLVQPPRTDVPVSERGNVPDTGVQPEGAGASKQPVLPEAGSADNGLTVQRQASLPEPAARAGPTQPKRESRGGLGRRSALDRIHVRLLRSNAHRMQIRHLDDRVNRLRHLSCLRFRHKRNHPSCNVRRH